MNVSGNRILRTTLALGIVALCLLSVPLSANLGLLFLYIEPNPRHMPPALMGEAVGWTIIGLLTAALTVVIAEAVFWPSNQRFLERNKALIASGILSLAVGATLGVAFAVLQMDSVDGQAMTSRQLAVFAGATAGTLGSLAGVIAGATLRRYIVSLYQLPDSEQRRLSLRSNGNDNGNDPVNHVNGDKINGAGQPAAGGRSHAG